VSFQTAEGGDRTFFRNGGRNIHKGVEGAIAWQLAPDALFQATASVGRYEFEEPGLSGNRLPGVPDKQLTASLVLSPGGFTGSLTAHRVGNYFVNDVNTAQANGYTLIDITLGYKGFDLPYATVRPFATVTNLGDQSYISAVTINANAGRYFDPGSGRTVQLGVNVLF
jgi:iron complex outermembrane receptor protein